MNKNRCGAAAGAVAMGVWLSGCVTVEMPNVVSDTAKVGKDVYQAYRASKSDAPKVAPAASAVPATTAAALPAEFVQNTYVGRDTQTIAEIKRLCVEEASLRLEALLGRPATYTVTENAVVTIEQHTVANCRLVVTRG